jgi:hypothetical protein
MTGPGPHPRADPGAAPPLPAGALPELALAALALAGAGGPAAHLAGPALPACAAALRADPAPGDAPLVALADRLGSATPSS